MTETASERSDQPKPSTAEEGTKRTESEASWFRNESVGSDRRDTTSTKWDSKENWVLNQRYTRAPE